MGKGDQKNPKEAAHKHFRDIAANYLLRRPVMAPQMKSDPQPKGIANRSTPSQPSVELEPIEEYEFDDESEEDESCIFETVKQFVDQDKQKQFVEETVEKINSIYRQSVDNGKLEIGGYLLDEVFKGKIEEAISTNPYKSATFKEIAENPALLVEAKTLGAWVRAAAVYRKFTDKNLSFPQLTTYHFVELAKVKDENRREEIAKDADGRGLTVKALRKLVSEENGKNQSASESIKQEVQRTMKALTEMCVSEDLLKFVEDMAAIKAAYTPGKALDLIPEVYASLENVQAAAQVLQTFAYNLDEIVNEIRKRRSA
jgi:hypothetical protein